MQSIVVIVMMDHTRFFFVYSQPIEDERVSDRRRVLCIPTAITATLLQTETGGASMTYGNRWFSGPGLSLTTRWSMTIWRNRLTVLISELLPHYRGRTDSSSS